MIKFYYKRSWICGTLKMLEFNLSEYDFEFKY